MFIKSVKRVFLGCILFLGAFSAYGMEKTFGLEGIEVFYQDHLYVGGALKQEYSPGNSWEEILQDFFEGANQKKIISPLQDVYMAGVFKQTDFLKKAHAKVFQWCVDSMAQGLRTLVTLVETESFTETHLSWFSPLLETLEKINQDNFNGFLEWFLIGEYEKNSIIEALTNTHKIINETLKDESDEILKKKKNYLEDLLQKLFIYEDDFFQDNAIEIGNLETIKGIYQDWLSGSWLFNQEEDDLEESPEKLKKKLSKFTDSYRQQMCARMKVCISQWKQTIQKKYTDLFDQHIAIFHIDEKGELDRLNSKDQGKKTISDIHITIGYETESPQKGGNQPVGNRKYSQDLIQHIQQNYPHHQTEKDRLNEVKNLFAKYLEAVQFDAMALYGNWVVTGNQKDLNHPHFSTPHLSWIELTNTALRLMTLTPNQTLSLKECYQAINKTLQAEPHSPFLGKEIPLEKLFIRTKEIKKPSSFGFYLVW